MAVYSMVVPTEEAALNHFCFSVNSYVVVFVCLFVVHDFSGRFFINLTPRRAKIVTLVEPRALNSRPASREHVLESPARFQE